MPLVEKVRYFDAQGQLNEEGVSQLPEIAAWFLSYHCRLCLQYSYDKRSLLSPSFNRTKNITEARAEAATLICKSTYKEERTRL